MNNLLDYNLSELTDLVTYLGEQKFRAKQLHNAILNGKDFGKSSVLPQSLLTKLTEKNYAMQSVRVFKTFKSNDGKTVKFLYKLNDDNIIEGVLMNHSYGRTLCVSTQVGCKMNCSFCASGLGFVRNLTAGEILGQIVCANTFVKGSVSDRAITNIVLMGSGEPLDNYDNVVKFLRLVTDKDGFGFSVRNITLSTCGIPSKIVDLADIGLPINLAISLHAPNDTIRRSIMPVAKSFPIASVIEAANHYITMTNRMVFIEYTLIDGVNSGLEHARELAILLRNTDCKVNLITLNDVTERGLKGVAESRANAFMRELIKNGITATIRHSYGDDIDGACGQLRNNEINGRHKSDSATQSQKNGLKSEKSRELRSNNKNTSNYTKIDKSALKSKTKSSNSFAKSDARNNSKFGYKQNTKSNSNNRFGGSNNNIRNSSNNNKRTNSNKSFKRGK